jgi:hypothetical protein
MEEEHHHHHTPAISSINKAFIIGIATSLYVLSSLVRNCIAIRWR